MSLKLGFRPALVVPSPKVAEIALKHGNLEFSNWPSMFYQSKMSYGCSDMAFAPYGEHWSKVRRITMHHLFRCKQGLVIPGSSRAGGCGDNPGHCCQVGMWWWDGERRRDGASPGFVDNMQDHIREGLRRASPGKGDAEGGIGCTGRAVLEGLHWPAWRVGRPAEGGDEEAAEGF